MAIAGKTLLVFKFIETPTVKFSYRNDRTGKTLSELTVCPDGPEVHLPCEVAEGR